MYLVKVGNVKKSGPFPFERVLVAELSYCFMRARVDLRLHECQDTIPPHQGSAAAFLAQSLRIGWRAVARTAELARLPRLFELRAQTLHLLQPFSWLERIGEPVQRIHQDASREQQLPTRLLRPERRKADKARCELAILLFNID